MGSPDRWRRQSPAIRVGVHLSAIGLYGTMAYAVVQHAAEIGLRMALGARRATVVDLVVRQALVLTAIGIAIGIPLTLGAARLTGAVLDQMLFGLEPYDPLVIGVATAMLALVGMAAAFVPARTAPRSIRSSRCDTSSRRPFDCR